jgi:hypothetical protein
LPARRAGRVERLTDHVVDRAKAADISFSSLEIGHAMDVDQKSRELALCPFI